MQPKPSPKTRQPLLFNLSSSTILLALNFTYFFLIEINKLRNVLPLLLLFVCNNNKGDDNNDDNDNDDIVVEMWLSMASVVKKKKEQ